MQNKDIHEIEKEYNLELDKVIGEIKKISAKRVLLQFPEGMKSYSSVIVDELEKKCKNADFLIWIGSCFGACDTPNIPENLNIDLNVQFGHSEWKK